MRIPISTMMPIICLMTLAACSDNGSEPDVPNVKGNEKFIPIELTVQEQAANRAQNAFAFTLFDKMCSMPDAPDNVVVSPLSAAMCLSMVSNGVADATLSQMLSTLGAENLPDLNALNRVLNEKLPLMDRKVAVTMGNSVWLDKGFKANEPFIKDVKENYDTEVREILLSSTEAMKAINAWCSENTAGLIPEFLHDPLSQDSKMFIANAIYFNGKWASPFENTHREKFTDSDGTSSDVEMMVESREIMHANGNSCSMVAIPYGNGAYRMLLILSNEREFSDCTEVTNLDKFNMLRDALKITNVNLKFPKFTVQQEFPLNKILYNMGMTDAFDANKANFSRLTSSSPLFISGIKQAIYIKVDEKGSEAAAVTGVDDWGDIGPIPGNPVNFFVNRPFVFIIEEQSTGAVLFMGRINKL